jgi:GeoRSP system SPASM domain protein
MNVKEISSPIRIYWDIDSSKQPDFPDERRIAEEITVNKVLTLQLTESAPVLSQSCLSILDSLKTTTIAISLVAPIEALDAQALGFLRGLPVRTIFALTTSQDDLIAIANIARQPEGKPAVGVSFPVTRANFHRLPDMLMSCIDHNIANFILPMQRLIGNEECFLLSPEERHELTVRLSRIDVPVGMKITIHDPFLWRTFYPLVQFPDGGCQAANTMLYISPKAEIYPCPTFPFKLGNLSDKSLKDIIHSSVKKELRKSLISSPEACINCTEINKCMGGCRGRAFKLNKSLLQPDPACK